MDESPQQLEQFLKRVRRKRFLKRVRNFFGWLLVALMLLLVALWFLIQTERVQNWAVNKVTTSLSQKLGTPVSVDFIDIDFFDKLVLNGFYVEDDHGDTLLYSGSLTTSLTANLMTLLGRNIDLDVVTLEEARFQLRRKADEPNTNLERLLAKFKSDNKKTNTSASKSGNPFFLDLDELNLTNIQFLLEDQVAGKTIKVDLPKGRLTIAKVDLDSNQFVIEQAELTRPDVAYLEFEKAPDTRELRDTSVAPADSTARPLVLWVHDFDLADASFQLHNYRKAPVKTTPDTQLDWKHLMVDDIQIDVDSFRFSEGHYHGQVNGIALRESSGFVLEKLAAREARVSPKKMELYDMQLVTPHSNLGDTLVMRYRNGFTDFKEFVDNVHMDAYFDQSTVALKDIMVFAPKLHQNKFFKKNEDKVFSIDGRSLGTVNSLKGRNVTISLDKDTYFTGRFSTNQITERHNEFIDLTCNQLKTNMSTLRQLIPDLRLPANFDRLGNINFNGTFFGFLNSFTAFGTMNTNLGTARMDIGLNVKEGPEAAIYHGEFDLLNFDLKTFTGNDQLGTISFNSKLLDSRGLTLETVSASGEATIQQFDYRGYNYENINLDGQLEKNKFNGKLTVKDDHIDLNFDGKINFTESLPTFDFFADVGKIDFKAINLSKKQDISLSGKLNIEGQGKDLKTLQGTARAYDLEMINTAPPRGKIVKTDTFRLDSLYLFSKLSPNNQRTIKIQSDVMNAYVAGEFEIADVPLAIRQFMERNFPEITERILSKDSTGVRSDSLVVHPVAFGADSTWLLGENEHADKVANFIFDLTIADSRNFTSFLNLDIDTIRNARINGYFSTSEEQLELDAFIPFIQFRNMVFDELSLDLSVDSSYAEIEAGIYQTYANNLLFEPIEFVGEINRDTMEFSLNSTNFNALLDDLNLNGEFFFADKYFQVRFLPSDLVILENKWDIQQDNYIRFGEKFVETKNFDLRSKEKRIVIESIDNKGLKLDLENVRLSLIDDFWDYEKLEFDGTLNVHASVGDLFQLSDINAVATSDTLEINGEDWGAFRLDAETTGSKKDSVDIYVSITKDQRRLTAKGALGPFSKSAKSLDHKDYRFKVDILNYPLAIAEYFIGNGISNTLGTFDADVKLEGNFNSKPSIGGTLTAYDLAVTINYLQTRYRMAEGTAKIDNRIFDASNNYITDELGNRALIKGGIIHDSLSNFGLNALITSDNFLFLDTEIEDNDLYYGKGIGSGLVQFTGTFRQPDIYIDATTGANTVLNIPVSYERSASKVSFINYRDKSAGEEDDNSTNRSATDLRGVEVTMLLDITDQAEVFIIFDERAGDKIRGRGEGSIELSVSRAGDITMYGDYIIAEGEYLFTLLNLVNKPFKVKRGGTIDWAGDPFNAVIDLEATYPGRTTLSTFLSEYFDHNINSDELEQLARKSTPVDLIMYLTGPLLNPDIDFDIHFPNVDNELRNFVESKLNAIRNDQNELNRQVFGLMVVGSFLPAGDAALSGQQGVITFNTVTEMLSNQLSIYLTELLSEVFTDVGFISGVDFDINYNVYTAEDVDIRSGDQVLRTGSELELRLRNNLLNDRLSINLGGNIDWGGTAISNTNEGAFLAGDLAIEYALTKDRRFKIRFYQLTDQTVEGRRNKTGLGFSYRREFDTFGEFIRGMRKSAKKVVDN